LIVVVQIAKNYALEKVNCAEPINSYNAVIHPREVKHAKIVDLIKTYWKYSEYIFPSRNAF